MIDKSEHLIIGFILGIIFSSVLYLGCLLPMMYNEWRKEAIKAGIGGYNKTSGIFEFISTESASGASQ